MIIRIWSAIREPRTINILAALAYAVLAVGGITALIDPPRSIEHELGTYAIYSLATMLTVGGTIAAPSALYGYWWLEKAGWFSIFMAGTVYGGLVTFLQFTAPGNRFLQLSFILAALILATMRIWMIGGRSFDPAQHPHDESQAETDTAAVLEQTAEAIANENSNRG